MQEGTNLRFWAQTPLAVFPPILGLFGLGLAWRRAAEIFPVPEEIGELMLVAVSLLFLFAAQGYLLKLIRRPGALIEDLQTMPSRAGASAGSISGMLLATALVPYSWSLAGGMLLVAVTAHTLIALVVLVALAPAPSTRRQITPVWHLTFVGFILAPLAAIPLGASLISEGIVVATLPLAIVIWIGHARLVRRVPVPPPLRPTLAIHLAPLCIFGIVTAMLGLTRLATGAGWLALLGAAVLVLRSPSLTVTGFGPLWGAFTFPLAAFVNLMLALTPVGDVFRNVGAAVLIAATIVIPIIALKVIAMWATGGLAPTNAVPDPLGPSLVRRKPARTL